MEKSKFITKYFCENILYLYLPFKTWQDLNKNTKSKVAAAKRYAEGTGGGEPSNLVNDSELQILELINPIQINGIEGIKEDPLNFVFNVVCH